LIAKESRAATLSARDAIAVAPAVGLFLGLVVYELLLNPTWVSDDGDEGAYFLMSRNVWHYGAPLLDQSGSAHWSASWSPGLSILLAPLGALPMEPSALSERVVIGLTGVAFLALAYVWMRRHLALSPHWAGLATICVAAFYALARVGALVLTDAPAAAALVGGVILLRRGRHRTGLALLLLAAILRPINIAALAAALAWLLLIHQKRRVSPAAAVTVLGALAVFAIMLAAGGFRGYVSQFAHPEGPGGIRQTVIDQSKELSWYPLGWFRAGEFAAGNDVTKAFLKLISIGLLTLATVVAVRRRLWLEAMIVAATGAVLLAYRTTGAGEARYLIPLSPFFVGAIFAGFRLYLRALAAPVAAAAALAAVAGGIHYYASATPSKAAFEAEVDAKRGAYRWVRVHVPRSAEVVAVNDIQSFLYSGHATVTEIRSFAPGHTFVVRMPPDSWEARHLLDGYRGHAVYRRGEVSIVQVDARTAPAG